MTILADVLLDSNLYVSASALKSTDTFELVITTLMSVWSFKRLADSRWLTVGPSARHDGCQSQWISRFFSFWAKQKLHVSCANHFSNTPQNNRATRQSSTQARTSLRFDLVSPWRLDHTGGSPQDTHGTPVPITMGRPWGAHSTSRRDAHPQMYSSVQLGSRHGQELAPCKCVLGG